MKTNKDILWNRISRIGLRDNEDVMQFREVILLNRILVVMLGVMCFYIPIEVYLNGSGLVHLVILMIVLLMLTLVFHYFRLFTLARYYVYLTGVLFVTGMGLVVGKGAGNYVSLIPVVLLTVILFRSNWEKVFSFILTVSLYLLQNYLFGIIRIIFSASSSPRSFSPRKT
jgi:hypothetical protein